MKLLDPKSILVVVVLLINTCLVAQVGINNTDPKSILDISASNSANPSETDGLLIPRVDAFPATNPGTDQNGMLVFLTTTDGSNAPGFYFWDNTATNWAIINTPMESITALIDADTDTSIELIEDATKDSISFKVNSVALLAIKEGGIHTNFGGDNLFIGKNAGENANNSGTKDNIGIGRTSLQALTSGRLNTALGRRTLDNITTGRSNVAIGDAAGADGLTTGEWNIAIGPFSMYQASGSSSYNTAIGSQALSTVLGQNNTAIGAGAGYNLAPAGTGSGNVYLGYGAGGGNTGNGNVFIGYTAGQATTGFPSGTSETLVIDNGLGDALVYGEFDNELLRINGTLDINNAYTLPTADGTNGQVLTTDGSGSTSWITPTTTNEILENGTVAATASASGSSFSSVTFSNTYTTPPNVQLTVEAFNFGEVYVVNVVNKTTTGFLIHIFRVDTPGSAVSNATISWMAY